MLERPVRSCFQSVSALAPHPPYAFTITSWSKFLTLGLGQHNKLGNGRAVKLGNGESYHRDDPTRFFCHKMNERT